jgi:hypothetical protein
MSEEAETSQDDYDALKGKLDQFRSNNVKLMKEKESLESKYADVDMDQYAELLTKHNEQKDKKLIDSGKIDELFEEKTKRLREDHNKYTKTLQEENEVYKRQLEGLMIDAAVRDNAIKNGVASTAIDDVLLRAKAVFKLKEGQAVPYDAEGNVKFSNGSSNPMSVEEWVKGLSGLAPHLFSPSTGSGSQHGVKGSAGNNTVTRDAFDGMSQLARSEFAKKGGKVVDS